MLHEEQATDCKGRKAAKRQKRNQDSDVTVDWGLAAMSESICKMTEQNSLHL
jgi:hypothetical protein